nr:MAG TPA: hypothetical protein [Caudoviricetes sp.]
MRNSGIAALAALIRAEEKKDCRALGRHTGRSEKKRRAQDR